MTLIAIILANVSPVVNAVQLAVYVTLAVAAWLIGVTEKWSA